MALATLFVDFVFEYRDSAIFEQARMALAALFVLDSFDWIPGGYPHGLSYDGQDNDEDGDTGG
jgi:hypothetical protein